MAPLTHSTYQSTADGFRVLDVCHPPSVLPHHSRVHLSSTSRLLQASGRSRHQRQEKKDVLFGRETNPPLPPSYDSQDDEEDFGSPACALAYATVDNEAHPSWSLIQVDVSAVPGVMRILSWLLNGLDLQLKEADWEIEELGSQDEEEVNDVVHIRMWVVEGYGKNLRKIEDPSCVEDRVTEYLRFCTNAERRKHAVIEHRGIKIDNVSNPERTLVTVSSRENGAESLLSMASTVTGLNLRMNHAKLDLKEELGDCLQRRGKCRSPTLTQGKSCLTPKFRGFCIPLRWFSTRTRMVASVERTISSRSSRTRTKCRCESRQRDLMNM